MSKLGETRSMNFIMFYIHFMNSFEGLGMFFSSTALIRRLHRYAATLPLFKKGHSMVNVSSVFSLGSALDECSTLQAHLSRGSYSHDLHQLVTEDLILLTEAGGITKQTLWSDGKIRKRWVAFFSGEKSFAVSAVKSNMMKLGDIKCDVKDISV